MTTKEEVQSYLNGNISNYISFLKKCSKKELLEAIEWTYILENLTYQEIIDKTKGWL